ncbi:MAG: hypothetical protein WD887_02475, partial [Candidatus Saccharimonadales bacterium]
MASNNKTDKSLFAWAAMRIGLGFIFLWAFLDKLLGLGFATCRDKLTDVVSSGCSDAWLYGGSPTDGYLKFASQGPFADFFQRMAGQSWVDLVFMAGLAALGVALILGISLRLASIAGILLMILMWSSVLPPDNNPVLDEHIIYAIALVGIAATA